MMTYNKPEYFLNGQMFPSLTANADSYKMKGMEVLNTRFADSNLLSKGIEESISAAKSYQNILRDLNPETDQWARINDLYNDTLSTIQKLQQRFEFQKMRRDKNMDSYEKELFGISGLSVNDQMIYNMVKNFQVKSDCKFKLPSKMIVSEEIQKKIRTMVKNAINFKNLKQNLVGKTTLRSMLVFGPEGCGKSYFPKFIMNLMKDDDVKLNASLYSVPAEDLISGFRNNVPRTIEILFEAAMEKSKNMRGPTFIFIENVDKLSTDASYSKALLNCLKYISSSDQPVFFIGSSSKPFSMDENLMNSFKNTMLFFGFPNEQQITEFFQNKFDLVGDIRVDYGLNPKNFTEGFVYGNNYEKVIEFKNMINKNLSYQDLNTIIDQTEQQCEERTIQFYAEDEENYATTQYHWWLLEKRTMEVGTITECQKQKVEKFSFIPLAKGPEILTSQDETLEEAWKSSVFDGRNFAKGTIGRIGQNKTVDVYESKTNEDGVWVVLTERVKSERIVNGKKTPVWLYQIIKREKKGKNYNLTIDANGFPNQMEYELWSKLRFEDFNPSNSEMIGDTMPLLIGLSQIQINDIVTNYNKMPKNEIQDAIVYSKWFEKNYGTFLNSNDPMVKRFRGLLKQTANNQPAKEVTGIEKALVQIASALKVNAANKNSQSKSNPTPPGSPQNI